MSLASVAAGLKWWSRWNQSILCEKVYSISPNSKTDFCQTYPDRFWNGIIRHKEPLFGLLYSSTNSSPGRKVRLAGDRAGGRTHCQSCVSNVPYDFHENSYPADHSIRQPSLLSFGSIKLQYYMRRIDPWATFFHSRDWSIRRPMVSLQVSVRVTKTLSQNL